MGKDDAPQLVPMLPEVGEVRQDQVYPRHLLVREGKASIYQQDAALLPHGGHVFTYLSQAT
jgi:hypothetical protein